MKYILLLLVTLIATISCSDSDDAANDSPILGRWQLTAMKVSPGGDAFFEDVTSSRTLTFYNNNTFSCNGAFCFSTLDATTTTTGTYSLATNVLSSSECTVPWTYTFTIVADTLLIDYPGIETVQAKYIKQ